MCTARRGRRASRPRSFVKFSTAGATRRGAPPWRRCSRRAAIIVRAIARLLEHPTHWLISHTGGVAIETTRCAVEVETPLVKEVAIETLARTPSVGDRVGERRRLAGGGRVAAKAVPGRAGAAEPVCGSRLGPAGGLRRARPRPRRQAPAPTPRPSMEPTYVRAPPELVDDVAMVPAIAMAAEGGLRPLAIAKAALAPMAVSAAVAACLPPRIQAALGLRAPRRSIASGAPLSPPSGSWHGSGDAVQRARS